MASSRQKLQPQLGKDKVVEQALQDSDAPLLQGLFEYAPDAIIVVDRQGRLVRVNAQVETMFGYSRAELIGHSLELLVPERFRAQHAAHRSGYMTQPHLRPMGAAGLELLGRRKDGSELAVDLMLSPLTSPEGELVIAVVRDITERKHVEKALRESEAQLRALADNLPNGVIYQYVLEPDGRHYFTYVSAGIERLAGIRAEEAIQDANKLHDLFLEEDRQRLWQATLESAEKLTLFDVEACRRLPTGEIRWSHYRSAPRRLPGGVTVWDGVEVDITARVQAEESLRESETKLRTLFEILPVGVTILDKDRRIVDLNPAVEKILSISKEGFLRGDYKNRQILRADGSLMPPAEFPTIRAFNEQSVVAQVEIGVVKEDGLTVWTNVSAAPLPVADLGVVVVTADITGRKRAEMLLRQSEQKFSVFFEKSAFAASLSRPPYGVLVDVNEAFERAFGYTKQEAVGKTSQELGLNPSHEERARILTALKEYGSVRDQEVALRTKSGEARLFSVSVNLVDIGDQQYILNTAQDITELKQAEAQLRASLREKEALLKEIHHRVKNNLQTISSLLKLQAEQVEDERILAIFQESQRRVRSMALIHETLYQSGDLARVDFAQYVQQLLRYLFHSYGLQSSPIEARIDIEEIALDLDTAVTCGLIINELVSNSLKYAFPTGLEKKPAGEIRIEMRAFENQIRLVVSDNGTGLPAGLDFRQTETLGLQLVNILTGDELEGTIEIDRTEGTLFKISFPRPNYEIRS